MLIEVERARQLCRAVFVEAFADPACKTTTVVYAILSHPEYHLN